jgi:mannose/fructose/N-acetylgalactosamine-specific phosphotransferase system component IID
VGALEIVRGLLALLFFQTSWSYVGRQGLGLKFVLLWVARTREQRQRIMEHCRGALNTNPFAAGAVIGSIVRAEYETQELKTIDRYTAVAQTTLAAGGDRFFWQVLRPALTALAVLLGLFQSPFAPLGFLVAFNTVTQGTRAIGLRQGYERGRDAIPALQGQFDRWSRSLGWFAAVVVGMILAHGLLGDPPKGAVFPFAWDARALIMIPVTAVSYLALRRNISQTYLLLMFLLIFLFLRLI